MKKYSRWIFLIILILISLFIYKLKHIQTNELEILDVQNISYNIDSANQNKEYIVLGKDLTQMFLIEVIFLLLFIIVVLILNTYKGQKKQMLLRQSKLRYKDLLMNMPNGVIFLEEKEFRFINQFGRKFLGLEDGEEMTYDNLKEMLGEAIEVECIALLPRLTKMQITTLQNEIKEVEITVVARNIQNSDRGIIIVIQDVSNRELLYESIERECLRNEFFANLTHEFKTPINLILTTTQLLEQFQTKEAELQRMLSKGRRILKQNAYRLTRLVNNMIDLTKTGSEDIKLSMRNCNIIQLAEDITLSTVHYAKTKGIKLLFDTQIEELVVAVDQDKFERIILNLLSNAIKYNKPKGDINVSMYIEQRNIVISIKDTGIGISEHMLPYIFDDFMQVNKSLIRNVEGSGVGLSLVRSFVALHHGKVEVQSKKGEGTTFTVYIPSYKRLDEKENNGEKIVTRYNDTHTQIELSDIYIGDF